MPRNNTNLGVFIPAYNEGNTIGHTLEAIAAQAQLSELDPEIVVVDNASTDNTPDEIEKFAQKNPGLRMHLTHEASKGTGSACRKGAEFLIEKGCGVIARTDADSIPGRKWLVRGYRAILGGAAMATGPVLPLRDEHYKTRDTILWTWMNTAGRPFTPLMRGKPVYMKAPMGCNTFFSSDAYKDTDGYPASTIAELDEDMVLAENIYESGGNFTYDPLLIVRSSMRRIRTIGYANFVNVYGFNKTALRLQISKGDVDIR